MPKLNDIEELNTLQYLLGLKAVARSGWLRVGLHNTESVADHSWGVALLACALCPDNLDRTRVLEMAILHDLAERTVGDITPFDGITPDEKHAAEKKAMKTLCESLKQGDRWLAIFDEYARQQSEEARFVHQMDKLDMHMQAEIYQATTQINLEEFMKPFK